MVKCSKCGTENLDEAVFCKECGKKISVISEETNVSENKIICCRCNTANPKVSAFCLNCGMKFNEETRSASTTDNDGNGSKDSIRIDYKLWILIILGIFGTIVIALLVFFTNKDSNISSEQFEIIEEPEEKIEEEHVHEFILEPISNTKHRSVCNIEGCNYYEESECTFVDDICECGNEIIDEKDITEAENDTYELLNKISGVWGYRDNYYLDFDGGDGFYHGWFYSEEMPYNHITSCKKIGENIYEIELVQEEFKGEDESNYMESFTWNATLDGSYDGFKSLFKMTKGDGKESYYIYVAESLDKAYERDIESFAIDACNQEYEQKLRELNVAKENVFDDEEICGLARAYYKKMNGEAPPLVSIDSRNGNELSIHLYEIIEYEDYPEENHAATWGWYYIDANTLEGTDFFGMPVNLNEVR